MKLLPLDCKAFYRADFLGVTAAERLFNEIVSGFDVTDKVIPMADGSKQLGELGTFMFTDPDLTSFEAFPEVWGGRSAWTDSLARVRDHIEAETGIRFQVARCVYYADGTESMGFHRDLPAYGNTDAIASLSLGVERAFVFRRTSDLAQRFTLNLAPGSLLLMGTGCQENYEHALPPDKHCHQARLNLTFRKYGWH